MFRKALLSVATLLAFLLPSFSQDNPLRFNEGGRFKIVQFTDTHLCVGKSEYRDGQAEKTFARLRHAVETERPDFLVFTGDIVTDGDGRRAWRRLLDTLSVLKTPYCIVFGNHDPETRIPREEMSEMIASSPFSLNELNKEGRLADVELEVSSSSGKDVPLVLYCMDSQDYSRLEGVKGYGWFSVEQVEWLRKRCNVRTRRNDGIPVNSLAFFHICLPEYSSAFADHRNKSVGRRAENECPGALNTGMFAAMVETGSVMGVFAGHDHDNDYIVADKGVALGYGRFSGDDTTYTTFRSGVRVIVLEEGKRAFETWILEDEGRIVNRARYENGQLK